MGWTYNERKRVEALEKQVKRLEKAVLVLANQIGQLSDDTGVTDFRFSVFAKSLDDLVD